VMPAEGDGAFAVVDVDMPWHNKEEKRAFTGREVPAQKNLSGTQHLFPGIDAGKVRCHAPGMDAPMQGIFLHGPWDPNLSIRW